VGHTSDGHHPFCPPKGWPLGSGRGRGGAAVDSGAAVRRPPSPRQALHQQPCAQGAESSLPCNVVILGSLTNKSVTKWRVTLTAPLGPPPLPRPPGPVPVGPGAAGLSRRRLPRRRGRRPHLRGKPQLRPRVRSWCPPLTLPLTPLCVVGPGLVQQMNPGTTFRGESSPRPSERAMGVYFRIEGGGRTTVQRQQAKWKSQAGDGQVTLTG